MNQEFFLIIAIIALGYFLKRIHVLREKDGEVIATLIFKVTLPALVIVTFDSVEIETSLIMLPVLVIFYGIVISILGLILFKNEEREIKGSFLMLGSSFNVGLFAFPLVYMIWGISGLTYFSMFDVGTSFITFGLAYILGSYFSKEGLSLNPIEILKKLGKSVPLMTYLFAVILNLSQISLPDTVIDIANILSQANIPLSLLLLGIYMNFKFDKQLLRPIGKYLAFRYSFGLLLGLALFFLLPYDEMFRYTIVIGYLLPAAASIVPFALEFNYSNESVRLIAIISNISIFIGIIIIYLFASFII